MLIARIFPHPYGARKNTTQLAKYPHILYAKPSNKVYLFYGNFPQKQGIAIKKQQVPSPQIFLKGLGRY